MPRRNFTAATLLLLTLALAGAAYWAWGPSPGGQEPPAAQPGAPINDGGALITSTASDAGPGLNDVRLPKKPTRPIADLKSERLRLAAAANDRAYAHAVLAAPSPAALRVALEASEHCAVGGRLIETALKNPAQLHPSLKVILERAQQRCVGIDSLAEDPQMPAALRSAAHQRKGDDPLLDLYLDRGMPSSDSIGRLVQALRLDDGDSTLVIAAVISADEKQRLQLIGDDALLREVPVQLLSLVWARAVCNLASCQQDSLRLQQCATHNLCSQASYGEQLDAMVASSRLDMPTWQLIVQAMEQRIRSLRDTGQ